MVKDLGGFMKILLLLVLSLFWGVTGSLADELVLTTYYPAPNGQYLNMNVSGTLTAATVSVTGDLTVVGQSTLGGNTSIGGNLDMTGGSISNVTTLATSGNVSVGGTLGVAGNVSIGGNLDMTGGSISNVTTLVTSGNISVGGALAASGNITTNGTLRAAGNIETGGSSHVNAQDYFIRANSRWASQLATETNLNNNVTNLQNQINALSAAISALQAQMAAGHTLTTSGVYDRVGTCDYGDVAIGTRYVMGTCGTYTCWFTVYTQCADVAVH